LGNAVGHQVLRDAVRQGRLHHGRHGPGAAGGLRLGNPPAPPELEVATLVADGLTNHAIASRLGIAPRTAESHVENIRRKLGVRSRAQIAFWITASQGRAMPSR